MNKVRVNRKLKIVLFHILFWIGYAAFNQILNIVQSGRSFVLDVMAKYFVAAFIFYSNVLFILPVFLKRKKYFLLVVSIALLYIASFLVKQFLYSYVLVILGYPRSPHTPWESFAMNSWWWFQYTLFGFGYWFALEAIARAREKAKLEQEKLRAEYGYLKAQINPHFLYNVLNFFYAKSLGASEELQNGILYLAAIMRYAISKGEDDRGRIPLMEEIEQIQNVIGINQLRFDNDLKVQFITEGNFGEVKIIPFIFITLVENAFKHGELTKSPDPLLIKITHKEMDETISLIVKNRKLNGEKEDSTGIGLENVKRRLTMAYGSNYRLSIREDKEVYSVDLCINYKA